MNKIGIFIICIENYYYNSNESILLMVELNHMSLREEILQLKEEGYKYVEIAKILGCSKSLVTYYCSPGYRERANKKRRDKRKEKEGIPKALLDKELEIPQKEVDWRHAEVKAMERLTELGYEVFTPITGGGEIDMIAYKDGKAIRIQVKSISPKGSTISFKFKRQTTNKKGLKVTPYENIDWFLIYDGTNIYKLKADEFPSSVVLRYTVPLSNQTDKIHMAKDYIL